MNTRTLLAILIAASAVSLTAIVSLFATYKTAFPAEFDACALKALHLEQTDAPSPLPAFARPIIKRFWQSEYAPICKQESVFTLLFRSVEPRWNAFADSAALRFNNVLETAQYYLPQSSFDLFGSWIDVNSSMAPLVDSARHFVDRMLETLPLNLPTVSTGLFGSWINVNSLMAPWIGYAVESYNRILKTVAPDTHDTMSTLGFGTFAMWAADEIVSTSASFFLVHLDAVSGILRALWTGAGNSRFSMQEWTSCVMWITATITATAVVILACFAIYCPGIRRELKVRIQEITDEVDPTIVKLRNWAFSLRRELKVRIQEITDEIGPTSVKLRNWAFSLRRELKVRIQEITDEVGPKIAWFRTLAVLQLLERAFKGLARIIVLVAKRAALLGGALVKGLLYTVIGMVWEPFKGFVQKCCTFCVWLILVCCVLTLFGPVTLFYWLVPITCLSPFARRALFYTLGKIYSKAKRGL